MPDLNLSDIFLADCNIVAITPELQTKATKDQKENVEIISSLERRTYLIVAAVHSNPAKNNINRISSRTGTPIAGYVYDSQSEAYCYDCNSYLNLGYIPISFAVKVRNTGWQMQIPMSESVLKKFMTTLQKRELKNFKTHFKSDEYRIEFLQLLAAN